MTLDLAAGVYSFEEDPQIRQIPGVPTSIIGAVGLTERGRIGVPVTKTSWPEWVSEFGAYIANSDLPQSIFAAFNNGARQVTTVRTAHYSDITNPLSYAATKASGNVGNAGAGSASASVFGTQKGPFTLANGQTLLLKKDGTPQSVVTFSGTRASAVSGNSENQDMSGGRTLVVKIDNGPDQTITFVDGDFVDPANATAEEVAAVINAQIVGAYAEDDGSGGVLIASGTVGSSSRVQVTGGTAQTEWAFPASTVGTGNVASLAEVTIAEIKSLLEAAVSGILVQDDGTGRLLIVHLTASSSNTLQVDATSTADTALGLDNLLHTGLSQAGTSATVTSTIAGPWALANLDALNITTDLGGPTATQFVGTRASVETVNTEAQDMSGGKTLEVRVNGGNIQTISFVDGDFASPANATAEEIVEAANKQVIGARFKLNASKNGVILESDRAGRTSQIEVVGGTAQAEWLFGTLNIGSGNVDDLSAVTFEEVKAIVEGDVAGVRVVDAGNDQVSFVRSDAGAGKSIQIVSGSAVAKFGLSTDAANGVTGASSTTLVVRGKSEGSYANALKLRIAPATSGQAEQFNLFILSGTVIEEVYPNLTMGEYNGTTVPSDVNYAPTVLDAQSSLFELEDSLVNGTALARRPENGDYALSGGDDGLTGLVDVDFVGDASGRNGIRALDTEINLGILIVPGRATSAVHNAMITYCEVTRNGDLFAILDPPKEQSVDDIITYVLTTAALKNATEYAAFYYPEVKVLNPNTGVFGNSDTITIPPSGVMAGVYSRTDDSVPGGVYLQPAGIETGILNGVLGLANDLVRDERVRDRLYPENINPIWSAPGIPYHADGSRCLLITKNFGSIGERRGVIFIQKSLNQGLMFLKHKAINTDNLLTLNNTIRGFLLQQMNRGAFASRVPEEAFFVDTGTALNTASERLNRRFLARVGLATATPGEFIVVLYSKDQRALQEEIASAA